MADERKVIWAQGNFYEPYVGRWSRLVGKDLLTWLNVSPQRDWLDVGCGTGALTETILRHADPRSVTSIDLSPGFIEYAKVHVYDPRASFQVGDAQDLPVGPANFHVAVAGLMLNFVPQPRLAVAEMARAVRPGGAVAAYVWDYAGRMEMMRYFWDAAAALDPEALDLDEGRRSPICLPGPLTALFAQVGLRDIDVRAIDVPTHFRDFDDYWSPFLGGQGPAPAYAMSLNEERRNALREHIRAALPASKHGAIDLVARAWAVRGKAP